MSFSVFQSSRKLVPMNNEKDEENDHNEDDEDSDVNYDDAQFHIFAKQTSSFQCL